MIDFLKFLLIVPAALAFCLLMVFSAAAIVICGHIGKFFLKLLRLDQ